jgi:hypothetical protein
VGHEIAQNTQAGIANGGRSPRPAHFVKVFFFNMIRTLLMVITRTPIRISFFGGGTDYPVWYREHGGATTIM